jgi:hypothetical protein
MFLEQCVVGRVSVKEVVGCNFDNFS